MARVGAGARASREAALAGAATRAIKGVAAEGIPERPAPAAAIGAGGVGVSVSGKIDGTTFVSAAMTVGGATGVALVAVGTVAGRCNHQVSEVNPASITVSSRIRRRRRRACGGGSDIGKST